MSFSVDQFMQVKCKLVLNSDTDSESVQVDNEKIRLCSSVHDKNAIIIVMICSNHNSNNNILTYYIEKRSRPAKPRIKQIFYHPYNEDIAAIALSENGNKLALINSSSTIYMIPIKNILLKSSQSKSMYFYDASILNCCSIDNPVAMVCWDDQDRSIIIVAGEQGKISFISEEDKKEIFVTNVNDNIIKLELIRDMCSYSLLITCRYFKQYRFTLKVVEMQQNQRQLLDDEYTFLEKDLVSLWDRKPIPIKLQSPSLGSNGSTAAALHRVLVPSGRAASNHSANLFIGRERSIPSIFYHSTANMISVVDILGPQKKTNHNNNRATGDQKEPRFLRFFSNKQFYYRPQKPTLISKINALEPDEKITHLVLTDRLIAIATDSDRCLINSKNCCNSKNSNQIMELEPLIKEIAFNNNEKILLLLKSPVSNDKDNIIDSFILVTNKCIYSIEARHSCRDMYINLIDSHLGIKPPRVRKSVSENSTSRFNNPNEYILVDDYRAQRKYSESNMMVTSFLCHRGDVYERINYDSKAFSTLFKLELSSLYEAYGDKLMLRNQFDLANRFFLMAKFDHTKTLGKYVRLGAIKETIEYVTNVISDENEILDDKERIDLSKAAFECLLAKTIVERSKLILYHKNISRAKLKLLEDFVEDRKSGAGAAIANSNNQEFAKQPNYSSPNPENLFELCEHSPRGHLAKLSGNTIVDDEATLTSEEHRLIKKENRLECEKALISFIKKLMPSSLYSYALTQLVDFGMIDLADTIARSDSRIHSLTRIILKLKEENRIIFRDGRFETLVDKLNNSKHRELLRIDGSEARFLEFITSPEVTRALVKDINLTSEYLGYQKTLVQFRKYSYTALKQLDSFRKLVAYQQSNLDKGNVIDGSISSRKVFSIQHKNFIETIFVEFLKASLDESTEDSCKLWYNYINFYLNYVGELDELKTDISNMLKSNDEGKPGDCRFAITLFKAIGRDESQTNRPFISEDASHTPLESMKKLYNLSELFDQEFLIELLERTLDIIPKYWYQNDLSHMLVTQ